MVKMLSVVIFLTMLYLKAVECQVLIAVTENSYNNNTKLSRIMNDSFIEKLEQQFSLQKIFFENLQNNTQQSINDLKRAISQLNTTAPKIIYKNITICHPKPTQYSSNCAEAVGYSNKSGLYKIQIPDSVIKPFYIYCVVDPDGGPAWTIIQRRTDGSIDFFLKWHDYKHGFGNLENEYFIGLDKLHELTTSSLQELWIKMEDFENVVKHAKYDEFAIGDENQAYALNVLGKFSGDAGDSLKVHAGQKFSTKDVKNDNNPNENCARSYHGAWWYHTCHQSNLNGLYLNGNYSKENFGQGINWFSWHGHFYSLKYTHMAIRPISAK